MQKKILNKDSVSIQTNKFADVLVQSNGYRNFDEKILENSIEYDPQKIYEIAQSTFVDFNHHLFENINEMHSISSGIYLEKNLITFRIFVWGSKGECYEIFKHVLIGDELKSINSIEDINTYICFEQFGLAIESRHLPLQSILQFISIQNNINDFR